MKYLTLIFFLICSSALAKPIDLQKIRDKEGARGEVEVGYDRQTGNSDETSLNTKLYGQYQEGRHLILGFSEYDLQRENGNDDGTSHLQHLRHRFSLMEDWYLESFAQREVDLDSNLLFKSQYGVGPYQQIISGAFSFGVGYAYVLEHERFRYDPREKTRRVHGYLNGGVDISPLFKLLGVLYTETKASNQGDHRVFTKTVLEIDPDPQRDTLILRINAETKFDSHPPTGRAKAETDTAVGFGLKF